MLKNIINSKDIIKSAIFDPNLPNIQYNLDQLLEYQDKMLFNLLKYWQISEEFKNLPIIEKKDMKFWRTPLKRKKISTSGTTASPFEYYVWDDVFAKIEIDNHYKYVLKEFDLLDKNISVLRINVEPHKGKKGYKKIVWKGCNFWLREVSSEPDYFMTHAATGKFYHLMYFPAHVEQFCDYLLNSFFLNHKIDVFLTPFSFISILLSQMKKPQNIAYLISNINEGVLDNEVKYILEEGIADYFCNHMRSWDGGCTFMTCKHGINHVLDYLSYVESVEGRLVSTDYFNLVGRFIRYWNGDYLKLGDIWNKCSCGRYYREFKIEGNRKPFLAIGNLTSWEVGGVLRVWIDGTSQAICYKNKIVIVTSIPLTEEKKLKIKSLIPTDIEFKVNSFLMSGRFNKILKVVDKTHENV